MIRGRDYALLDEIHPGRIRTVEQWLRRAEQLEREAGRGGLWEKVQPENLQKHSILKLGEDQREAFTSASLRFLASYFAA